MTTFEKLERILKQKGVKPTPMLKQLGFSASLYSQWRQGQQKPSRDKLIQISKYLDIPISYFLDDADTLEVMQPAKYRQIPIYESVSAGFGAYPNDSIVGYMPLFIVNDEEAAETIIIRVRGNSMYPRIEDGALVQVHKQNYAENGKVVVMLIDGEEAVLKRYFCDLEKEVVRLESYNPEYPPRVFMGDEIKRLKILGVAVRVTAEL